MLVAERDLITKPANAQWFRTAIATPVEVTHSGAEYGSMVMSMTDPTTGQQRRVRIRTIRGMRGEGEEAYKSEAASGTLPDMGALRLVAHWPRLTKLMFGSDDPLLHAPTAERQTVMELMGLL